MRNPSLLVAALLTLSAAPALAFEMNTNTHAGSTVTLNVNPTVETSFPDEYAKLLTAESKVNGNASDLRFNLVIDGDAVTSNGNGESELTLTTNTTLLCSSIGCAHIWTSGGNIVEADVYLKTTYAWTLTDEKLDNTAYSSSGSRPLVNVAIHEMLHAMGVKHENDCINIMGQEWDVVSTNGDYTEVVVSEDSTAGLQSIYGLRSTPVYDISVMHWKFDAAGTGASAYSNHERSELLNSSGTALTPLAGYDEPTYAVNKGQVVQVEMTLENRGTTSQTRNLGTYWSTNDLISTVDTLLTTTVPTLNVNVPYETTRTVTIPSTATSGTVYWIGAILDNDDALSEANEINNAAYIVAVKVN